MVPEPEPEPRVLRYWRGTDFCLPCSRITVPTIHRTAYGYIVEARWGSVPIFCRFAKDLGKTRARYDLPTAKIIHPGSVLVPRFSACFCSWSWSDYIPTRQASHRLRGLERVAEPTLPIAGGPLLYSRTLLSNNSAELTGGSMPMT